MPRLINLICDRALLAGYVAGTRTIDAGLLRRAARELSAGRRPRLALQRLWPIAAALAAVAAAGGLLAQGGATSAPATPTTPAETPAPVAAASVLEPVLLSLPSEGSYEAAVAEVESLWGGGPTQRTELLTHLDQIRRLDLPVVLEMFHPDRRDLCHVALLAIDGDEAVLGTGSGVHLRAPVAEVARRWTRRAVFLWKDFDSLDGAARSASTAAWVRERLAKLGYLDQAGAGAPLSQAVARFQRDADLVPDGLVGQRTLMALYSLSDYPQPRLSRGPS